MFLPLEIEMRNVHDASALQLRGHGRYTTAHKHSTSAPYHC